MSGDRRRAGHARERAGVPDPGPVPAPASTPGGRPPHRRQGFALLFTGFSGACKSPLAGAVSALLRARTGRAATLLDGDAVRRILPGELGYSHADRETHLGRVGFVAAEVARYGGIALCALIAPYAAGRRALRGAVEAHGGFAEVHVSTPLAACEARDPRGLYAGARAGRIERFTGIGAAYEAPSRPDLAIDTAAAAPGTAARRALETLERLHPVCPTLTGGSRPGA